RERRLDPRSHGRALAPLEPTGGKVEHQGVELTVGPGGERRREALLELVGEEPAFGRGLAQPVSDALALCVRRSKLCSPCHLPSRLARAPLADKSAITQ